MRTSELNGRPLNWAVAKVVTLAASNGDQKLVSLIDPKQTPDYSTDWAAGGPIIDQAKITITQGRDLIACIWVEGTLGDIEWYRFKQRGPTPLIAAMRCYVASKLGENIDIPKELL